WYRDMREPGFLGANAPSSDNSLQWLAHEIVEDPRFARAAVKFWWPSVIGSELIIQPEVESDANYQAKLMAYNAQTAAIQTLADSFINSGMNLKDLLVEMTMTSWFRASGVNDSSISLTEAEAHSLVNLGSERLLTPEQLSRKSTSLTGYTWRNGYDFQKNQRRTGLESEYQMYYGGIDSAGVSKRSTDMTALMSTVAMTHASEASCPIVLREFALTDGSRALFNGFDPALTPLTIGFEAKDLETTFSEKFVKSSTSINLSTSPSQLYISLNNGWCDWNETTQQCDSNSRMEVQSLEIEDPDGMVRKIIPTESNSTISPDCAWYHGGGVGLCNTAKIEIPFTPSVAGEYKLTATVWPLKEGADVSGVQSINFSIGAETAESPILSTAMGAQKIRQKLVDLHHTLHGSPLSIDSPEIDLAYQLFVESWDEIRNLPNVGDYQNINWAPDLTCARWQDYAFGVGMPLDFDPYKVVYNDWGNGPYPDYRQNSELEQFLNLSGVDPLLTKRAWITVMTYMLSHYDYLYE
ncbi:MAG: hypothetical protein AB8B95_06535, partial [Pseudohongiellaceae bacterium]